MSGDLTGRRILLVGCGYLGHTLSRQLATSGARVTAWVRTAESARELAGEPFAIHTGDVAEAADWGGLEPSFDAVVHGPSSGRRGAEAYRRVYVDGLRQVIGHLPGARLVFVSSTSVYGQANGSWVDETSPAEPATDTGRLLREAEDLCMGAGGTVARVAGIYGPGRGVLYQRLLAGEAVIAGDGSRWINQAHRDDIAAALALLLASESPPGIVNVTDNEPATYNDFYAWACERTGLPFPPHGPADPTRKRGLTHKRVANTRLRALGWTPRYPTFREGYAAAWPFPL